MNKPVSTIDTVALVKPTRWHVPKDRMVLTCGASATTLSEALADNSPVIPPDRTEPIGDPGRALELLKQADPRFLLMALVHLTGEESLLDRFAPYITAQVAGGAKGVAGATIPEEMQRELRERIVGLLSQSPVPEEKPVSARLAQKMMSACVGEPVGDEFLPFVLEQAGFTGTQGIDAAQRARSPKDLKVVVIGAGLSGIALGAQLSALGYDFEVFEKNPDAGGTWLVNRYPGVAVDTPSHYYSYSFDINPDWPKYFSRGQVLYEYLQRAAERFGVRERTRFETEVLSADWDEGAGRWKVRVRGKDGAERTVEADVVVPAINFLAKPFIPDFDGLERFKGRAMHTAQWDEQVDLAGKRVAVIGTGASSMQVCTTIAPQVEHLTVLQRSRHWVVPAPLVHLDVPEGARWAMRHVPHYAQWQRFLTYWTSADGLYPLAVVDPEWTMPEVSISAANERRRQILLAHIASELEGRPDLIEKVTPNYPPMGKRIILDAGWYKMLRRDNVDLEAGAIREITEDAIITQDGKRVPVDVIVFATGFVLRPMLPTLKVTGRSGLTLDEAWADEDTRAYLGMLVPDFPNFFIMNGPNSVPTHGAGQNLTAETTSNYIVGLLDLMVKHDVRSLEVTPEAVAEYDAAVAEALSGMVWNHPKASSYYLNKRRRNTLSCPWRLVDYWWMTRRPEPSDLRLTPRRR
jgi:4-hydroxyacetophenone monooxygenase